MPRDAQGRFTSRATPAELRAIHRRYQEVIDHHASAGNLDAAHSMARHARDWWRRRGRGSGLRGSFPVGGVRLNDIGEGVSANVPANTLDAAWLREALRG